LNSGEFHRIAYGIYFIVLAILIVVAMVSPAASTSVTAPESSLVTDSSSQAYAPLQTPVLVPVLVVPTSMPVVTTPVPTQTPEPATSTPEPTPAVKASPAPEDASEVSRGSQGRGVSLGSFLLTGYDLSVDSCGKAPSHPAYGITKNGTDLVGLNASHRLMAVDPTVIPLGTSVYVDFPQEIRYLEMIDGNIVDLTGIWTAVDVGGGVKGKHLDLFMGEDAPGGSYYAKLCTVVNGKRATVYTIEE